VHKSVTVCALSIWLCYSKKGLLFVIALALLDGTAFAVLWQNPNYQHGEWPLLTWLSHLLLLAFGMGIIVGMVKLVYARAPSVAGIKRIKKKPPD
jgi:hypothetical protein